MKDAAIRYRPAERAAFIAHQVQAFCLTGGNLRAAEMARQYLAVLDRITAACRQPGPALHVVSASGIQRVSLDP